MNETIEAPAVIEASKVTQTIYATAKQEFKMPSAGEWIAAQFAGGAVAAEFNARLRAAAPSVTTADLDGIMPTPIVAPIYSGIQGLRPVVDAIGVRAMPQGGKIFIVPKITTHTSIGGPETQNATITAGQFIVDDIQVTKAIYGGYVQLSEASIDWSDPEVLGALLEDLAKNGNITAQQSLAENQKIIDEANKKKEREQKRIQRIKLAETALTTYSQKVESGSKTPLADTIRDIALFLLPI